MRPGWAPPAARGLGGHLGTARPQFRGHPGLSQRVGRVEEDDEEEDDFEELLDNPGVRALLELMKKNMELQTQLEVAKVRMEAQEEIRAMQLREAERRIEELERALREAAEQAEQATVRMHEMAEHVQEVQGKFEAESREWKARVEELAAENRHLHEMLEHRDRQLRDAEQALEGARRAQAATESKLRELLAKLQYVEDMKKAGGKKEAPRKD